MEGVPVGTEPPAFLRWFHVCQVPISARLCPTGEALSPVRTGLSGQAQSRRPGALLEIQWSVATSAGGSMEGSQGEVAPELIPIKKRGGEQNVLEV